MFSKAEKKTVKLKIAVTGVSGSGKTLGALKIAKGIQDKLGGKIAVVDTENGSASLYADKYDFDTAKMTPPFLSEKYSKAINEAVTAGYNIIILDSISHCWAAEGGLLEQKEALDRGGSSNKSNFANWAPIGKKHNSFLGAILQSDIHVISTMRSKQEYALVEEKGKQVPKKIGLAPIQRDQIEYEFTVVFDVNQDHMTTASKDRTGLFDEKFFKITEETGHDLVDWLNDGAVDAKPKNFAPGAEG